MAPTQPEACPSCSPTLWPPHVRGCKIPASTLGTMHAHSFPIRCLRLSGRCNFASIMHELMRSAIQRPALCNWQQGLQAALHTPRGSASPLQRVTGWLEVRRCLPARLHSETARRRAGQCCCVANRGSPPKAAPCELQMPVAAGRKSPGSPLPIKESSVAPPPPPAPRPANRLPLASGPAPAMAACPAPTLPPSRAMGAGCVAGLLATLPLCMLCGGVALPEPECDRGDPGAPLEPPRLTLAQCSSAWGTPGCPAAAASRLPSSCPLLPNRLVPLPVPAAPRPAVQTSKCGPNSEGAACTGVAAGTAAKPGCSGSGLGDADPGLAPSSARCCCCCCCCCASSWADCCCATSTAALAAAARASAAAASTRAAASCCCSTAAAASAVSARHLSASSSASSAVRACFSSRCACCALCKCRWASSNAASRDAFSAANTSLSRLAAAAALAWASAAAASARSAVKRCCSAASRARHSCCLRSPSSCSAAAAAAAAATPAASAAFLLQRCSAPSRRRRS